MRFETLRRRLCPYEYISCADFRMFVNLFNQERRSIVQIFAQKVIELQEHKKATSLNGMFVEMRGRFIP